MRSVQLGAKTWLVGRFLRLESTFGEFVEGLNRQSAASFPLTLKARKQSEVADWCTWCRI